MAHVYARGDRRAAGRTHRAGVRSGRVPFDGQDPRLGTAATCSSTSGTVAPLPEMPRGEHAIFRYELTPDGDATDVLVTYRRITKQTARGFLPGLMLPRSARGATRRTANYQSG